MKSSLLGFVIVNLWATAVLALPLPVDDDPQPTKTTAQVDPAEIARWISLLGSDHFAEREAATEALWQMGQAAEDGLKRASQSPDRETAFRASTILNRFRLGIFPDTAPEKIQLIRRFTRLPDAGKQTQIRNLLNSENIEDATFLIDLEDSQPLRSQLDTLTSQFLESLAPKLYAKGHIASLEKALRRFSVTPQSQFLLASYAQSQGPEKVEETIAWAQQLDLENDPGNRSTDDLIRIQLLLHLVSDNQAAAPDLISYFENEDEKRGWKTSIAMLNGDFAELIPLFANAPSVDQLDPESLTSDNLVLAIWAARAADHRQWLEALEPQVPAFINNQRLPIRSRIMLDLVTDRFETALQESAKIDQLLAFSILCNQEEYLQAMTRFGGGATREERSQWAEGILAELAELETQKRNPRQPLVYDEQKLRILTEEAGWLLSLGEFDEGAQILSKLFDALPAQLSTSSMIQQRILDLEFRYRLDEAFCQHALKIYTHAKFENAFAAASVSDSEAYAFWWRLLEAEFPKHQDRLAQIRNLLLEPLTQPLPENKLREWIEVARELDNKNLKQPDLNNSVQFANACWKHGHDQLAISLLMNDIQGIAQNGELPFARAELAAKRLAKWFASQNRWTESLEISQTLRQRFDERAQALSNRTDLDAWLNIHKIHCLKHLDRDAEAEQALAELLRQQFSYNSLNLTAELLAEVDMTAAAGQLWKRMAFRPSQDPIPFASESYNALSGLTRAITFGEAKDLPPHYVDALIGQILASNNPFYLQGRANTFHPVLFLLTYREGANQAYARQLFANDQKDLAVRRLQRAIEARPGNVDNLVAFADDLLRLDGKADSDALLDVLAQQHEKTLEQFPQSAMHHNNLAWLYARTGNRIPDALLHAKKATELRPLEDNYVDTYAEAEFQAGNIQQAVELARRCVKMNPDYPHYQDQLRRFEAALENQ